MQSKATTVAQYLAELPPERRAIVEELRRVFLDNLDGGFEEGMQYGMIGYYVPHSLFPAGYHCDPKQPLPYAGICSQKNYVSLYIGCVYQDSKLAAWFQEAWKKTGRKLDMGKACIRFKKIEDVPLDVVAETLRKCPLDAYVKEYVRLREEHERSKGTAKPQKGSAKAPKRKSGSPAKARASSGTKQATMVRKKATKTK